jgi:O-antigen/teichoic acid export membrane protein
LAETVRENHAATVRNSLSRNLTVDIAARIGYLVSRFFVPPFIIAHVTLEAYGLWATAFIVVSYIGVSTMGISNVYIKYVAEYSARKDYKRVNQLLSTGLMITVPACLILFALLCLLWPQVVNWLHVAPSLRVDAREVVLSVIAIFLASIGLSAFRDALTGCQQSSWVQVTWVAGYVIETILIFSLVAMGRGIRGLSEAFLVRTAIEVGLCMWIAFRRLPWLRISPRLFSREATRVLFSFGGIVQIQSLLAIALNSIERAMAVPLVGLAATGLLDIANKLPSMAASIPSAFASSFVPAASYLQGGLEGSEGQRDALRKLYLKGARYMNLTSAYVCGLIATIPLALLDVWMGKRFPGAPFLVVVFTIATQVHLMTGPGTSILKGVGRPREEFFYAIPNVLVLLAAMPACYLIEGRWTAVGIGTAVSVATVISAGYFIRHANNLMGIPFREYFKAVLLPGMMPYLPGLALSVPVTLAVTHVSRWTGASIIGAAGLIYTVIVFWLIDRTILNNGERLWFRAVVDSQLGRFSGTAFLRLPRFNSSVAKADGKTPA